MVHIAVLAINAENQERSDSKGNVGGKRNANL